MMWLPDMPAREQRVHAVKFLVLRSDWPGVLFGYVLTSKRVAAAREHRVDIGTWRGREAWTVIRYCTSRWGVLGEPYMDTLSVTVYSSHLCIVYSRSINTRRIINQS